MKKIIKANCLHCGVEIDFSDCSQEIGHLTGLVTRKKKCEKCGGQNNYSIGDANKNPIGKVITKELK